MQPHNNKESNPHDQERLLCRETEGNSLAQDINPSNIIHQRNSNYRSNTIMNDLQKMLNRLCDFKVVDAKDNKAVFETPEGDITASYRIGTLRTTNHAVRNHDNHFPLQAVFHISAKGNVVFSWGSMTNEQNAIIIDFFREKNEKNHIRKYEEDKQTKKDVLTFIKRGI